MTAMVVDKRDNERQKNAGSGRAVGVCTPRRWSGIVRRRETADGCDAAAYAIFFIVLFCTARCEKNGKINDVVGNLPHKRIRLRHRLSPNPLCAGGPSSNPAHPPENIFNQNQNVLQACTSDSDKPKVRSVYLQLFHT